MHALALHNLSSEQLFLAHRDETPERARQALIAAAIRSARKSVELRPASVGAAEAAASWNQLGEACMVAGDTAAAIEAFRRAVSGVSPDQAPQLCRDTGQTLAYLASDEGDWELAATAFRTATEGALRCFSERSTRRGRLAELRDTVNLFRFASYVYARVGESGKAVEVAELGRARELGAQFQTDLVDLDRLRALDPSLCDRLITTRQEVERVGRDERSGVGIDRVAAQRRREEYETAILDVRALPGFERLFETLTWREIAAIPASKEAIVYIVTSPHGSSGLMAWTDAAGENVEAVMSEMTSGDVVPFLFGDLVEEGVGGGYIGATVGNSETEAISDSCAALSSCIGPKLLKPIAERLRANGIERICLIPMGIMGLLPLHALDWSNGATRECLLDRFEVTFTPSAAIRAVCGHRAADLGDAARRLVVVGNPLPHSAPLPGARYEAQMVERTMDAADSTLLLDEAATKDAAIEALPGASHVHLACHGAGAFFGETLTAGLSLAHEEVLSASEILDLDTFEPRLVVASACETGVIQSYEAADEALSMANVMLAAGAACTIATLWSVDDWTTAVLMSRLYELISGSDDVAPVPPAAALRRAQLWLRTLTPDGESSYVKARPALLDHRAGRNLTATDPSTGSCYASTASWAAFVASGA